MYCISRNAKRELLDEFEVGGEVQTALSFDSSIPLLVHIHTYMYRYTRV